MNGSQHIKEIQQLSLQIAELRQDLQNATKPPDQVILDDYDLRNYMKVSKRTTAYWREKGLITFSKINGKLYYKLSEVLEFIKQYEFQAIGKKVSIHL
jgi:hypothetical protein